MAGGDDWLLRPALAGLCHVESLLDGTLSIADVAWLNHALDVRRENELRVEAAMKEGG